MIIRPYRNIKFKCLILRQFAMRPYNGELITEEEFIYDGLNIEPLFQVLKNSLRNYNAESESECDDSETEETIEENKEKENNKVKKESKGQK